MSAIVLYEILHCLAAACLAVRLFCHAHSPAQTKRYVLAGAAACLFLGDVYWLAHLIIRGEPPAIFFCLRCSVHRFSLMFNTALPGRGSAAFASAALRGMDGGFYSYERCGMDGLDRGMVQQSVMGRSHAASCHAQRHDGGKRPAPGQTNRFFRTGGSIGFLRGSCACRRSIPYACSPVRPTMGAVACSAGFHAQGQSETAFCSGVGAYGGFL